MSSLPNAAIRLAPRTWQSALRLIAGLAVFWAFAAGVLFIAAPGLDTFGRLLVFNECVGMAMVALAMLLRPSPIALDETLDNIANRYGEPTANLVALELEHRRRRSAR